MAQTRLDSSQVLNGTRSLKDKLGEFVSVLDFIPVEEHEAIKNVQVRMTVRVLFRMLFR